MRAKDTINTSGKHDNQMRRLDTILNTAGQGRTRDEGQTSSWQHGIAKEEGTRSMDEPYNTTIRWHEARAYPGRRQV